jgi:hypothetical protein
MFGPSITGFPGFCGLAGMHRLHRLRRLDRVHRLRRLRRVTPVLDFAASMGDRRRWARPRSRPEPTVLWLVLAGLAVISLAKVMTALGSRRRSTTEKVLLGAAVVLLGLVVLRFRRSAARYR